MDPREKLLAKLDALMGLHRYQRKALAAAIGVKQATVNNWFIEGGKRSPTTAQWLKIARTFGLTMESLTDPEMEPVSTRLPEDEEAVLGQYRHLRATAALDSKEAIRRLSDASRPFVGRPAAHPDDAKGSR